MPFTNIPKFRAADYIPRHTRTTGARNEWEDKAYGERGAYVNESEKKVYTKRTPSFFRSG